MRVRRSKVNFRNSIWYLFSLGIIAVLAMMIYFPTYSRYKKLREENTEMVEKIECLREEINELEQTIKNLEKNPFLLEKIARESIGVAKDNEIVVDIEE